MTSPVSSLPARAEQQGSNDPSKEVRPTQTLDRGVGAACIVVALVATSAVLHEYELGWADQSRLWAATVGTILVPGWLIVRRVPLGHAVVRIGAAFVTGLGAQLFGWALAVRLHLPWLQWIVPLVFAGLIAGAMALLPGRFGRQDEPADGSCGEAHDGPDGRRRAAPARMPWWACLGLLFSWLLFLRSLTADLWSITPLGGTMRWYPDMYWHTAITANAMHHVPPNDPQSLADGVLDYHWFSNAHAAGLTIASGVQLEKAAVVFWYVPAVASMLLLVYGLAAYLSRSAAGGLVAAALSVLAPSVLLVRGIDPGASSVAYWLSPSNTFSLPVAVLATFVLCMVLRANERRPDMLAFTIYVLLLCPGSKVSLLPTLLSGVGLVTIVTIVAVIRRRAVWHDVLRPVSLLTVGAAIVVSTMPLFAGGGGGSTIEPGATARRSRIWTASLATDPPPGSVTLALLVAAFIGTYLAVTLVAATVGGSRDPAPVLYLGMMVAALLAMFLIEHPAFSQIYFMRGIVPVTAAFLGWGAIAVVRRLIGVLGARRAPALITVCAVAGAGIGMFTQSTSAMQQKEPLLQLSWLLPMVVVLFVTSVMIVILLLRRDRISVVVGAVLAFSILGFAVAPTAHVLAQDPIPQWHTGDVAHGTHLNQDEIRGAAALARANVNASPMATNVHCSRIRTTPRCDPRAFWPAALTRSPAFIGAWAYTASGRASGTAGVSFLRQPYYDQRAYALNESVFRAPTARSVAALRAYGVRFLYADRRASAVSADLARYADVIWRSPTVTVYELR